ncbi:hypothetical protein BDQ17DRAFT_1409238 [Cyathus striatus]|nr:hypothetical protein BDQ17DRAFT_1409238 [Cyathus striatus]
MSYPSNHRSNPYVQPTSAHRYHSAPIPYSGAAPPIPSWVNVNPSSWQAGCWQPNPYYKPQVAPSHVQYQAWVPGQAWHQYSFRPPAQASQQAQQAVWNHYKRPKQPSKEYLQNKLLKNPLALEGMIPAEELGNVDPRPMPPVPPVQYPEEIQSTPWIWAPRLLADAEPPPQQPTHPPTHPPIRNSSEPPPSRPHGNHDPSARQPPDNQRTQPGTSSSTSAQPRAQSEPPVHEAFTSKQELHTTFSPRVIRTPDRTHSRSSMNGSSSLGRSSSVDSVASQIGRMSLRSNRPVTPPNAEPWNRPSAQAPMSGVRAYSEEPSSILSPLIMDNPLQPPAQPLGRHGSAPVIGQSGQSSLGTIPETREPSRATYNTEIYSSMPKRKKSKTSKKSSSTTPPSLGGYSSSSSRPSSLQFDNKDSGYNRDSGYSSSSSAPPSATFRGIIPGPPQGEVFPERDPNLAHLFASRSNPLPAPPREVPVEYSPPRVNTPPPTFGPCVRIGFWNKRGDHLLPTGQVVYAPVGKMYPPELADYPEPESGYKDDWGVFAHYLEARPELPQSLPSRGLPPARPYESFVKYKRNQ